MQDPWYEHTRLIIGLFAIMMPFAVVPVMIGLTRTYPHAQRHITVLVTVATCVVILLAAQYAGEFLIRALGTSMSSFQIAGGIVIALSGFAMLAGQGSRPQLEEEVGTPFQIGIVPLGLPLLAGPGAITKVMLESEDNFGVDDPVVMSVIIVGVCLTVGIMLWLAGTIARVVGATGLVVLTRLSGLIVVAIGVEIVAAGVFGHLGHRDLL